MGKMEGTEGEPEKVKHRSVTINSDKEENAMEEGKNSSVAFMPKLPKPLTIDEKKYLLAVERGDISTVRKMLQKSHRHRDFMDMDCVDPLGRGALHMTIDNENLEMVELLVVMGVETKDALLHAIDVEFVEAVEVLLEHEEVIHKEGEPYSWERVDRQTASFTPEITPLILAAHRDNYEILKILLDRGAMLPMPHDIRCGCPECISSSTEDSLRHSMSRINSYRALASPSLIALSSTDPILTAFELSWELKTLAYSEQEFRQEYLELRRQCRDFAEELLSHTRSSTELAVILNYDPEEPPYEDGEHMKLRRLELAMNFKQKKFVAHANVQQLLAAIWYEGLPGFRRKEVSERMMEIIKVAVLFPFYCLNYMMMPDSPKGKLMRTPFMKFLVHSSSYLFFLLLLILVSVRFEDLIIYLLGTDSMRMQLEESSRRQRGNLPTPSEVFVFLYVFGFLWEEIQEIRNHGLGKYFRNMWNILDMMRDTLYISTIILRIGAFVQQTIEINNDPRTAYIPKEEWDTFDPQLISEGLFAAANILSALKLVHIFSINPYLGPLQISLGRMVIDIVKFFFIYSLVLFAFACGLTQLLWYYNDLEKQKCYSLPGGLPDWTKQGDACMKWRRFHNLFEASQSLFWAGFGMVGLSDFELTGIREYTRFWSMLMFGSYSVINIIVLLNLLIAMMSSSYSFIVEHADTEWKFARTKLWMSYFEEGKTLPPPFNIFPNIKLFRKLFKSNEEERKLRRMSTRTQHIKRKARDYRYLGVMRALIWRYICSLQRKNIDSPVTEDDINEVKGDISSLRFELIDLFGQNGMDISACSKKSKAALGRKMKIWERRLMRDFHVSPAMGAEETTSPPAVEEPEKVDSDANNRFKRVAKLAMTPKMADIAVAITGKGASQIGRTNLHDDTGRENLKKAMEKARRKMEEDTPDCSANPSRACSPYSDLYRGPNLLDAIESLDLSPMSTAANTPMPQDGTLKPTKDGQAKDKNLLVIPGRRSEKSLDKGNSPSTGLSINVPPDIFSKNVFKKLSDIDSTENKDVVSKVPALKKEAKGETDKKKSPPPATISTVSETESMQVKKENDKSQKKALIPPPKGAADIPSSVSEAVKPLIPQKKEESKAIQDQRAQVKPNFPIAKLESDLTPPVHQSNPKKEIVKPAALRIDPKFEKPNEVAPAPSIVRPRPHGMTPSITEKGAPAIIKSFKQPQEQAELQNTDIVRKPRMPPRQGSQNLLEENKSNNSLNSNQDPAKVQKPLEKSTAVPKVAVTPSTPIAPSGGKKQMISIPKQEVSGTVTSEEKPQKKEAPPVTKETVEPEKCKEEKGNTDNLKQKDLPKREAPVPVPAKEKQQPEEKKTKEEDPKISIKTELPKTAEQTEIKTEKEKNDSNSPNPKIEPPADPVVKNMAPAEPKPQQPVKEAPVDPAVKKMAPSKPNPQETTAPPIVKGKRTESIEESGITPKQTKKGGWL